MLSFLDSSFLEITEFRDWYLDLMICIMWIYLITEGVIEAVRVKRNKPKEASYGIKRIMLVSLGILSLVIVAIFQPRWQIVFVFVGLVLLGLFERQVSINAYLELYKKGVYIMGRQKKLMCQR
ncbi:hypothetical protein [Eubacterium oxidoreducens]|uniref:Uncharacterized protein n=1 Tax=Eubacterium oxidoreducens TaxID=1732 RepID=A0A1G6AKR3_EUBOX|nr:hypothetical protein [Eubacterium oxidoreducens]SDB08975.1 hypothetical protein SAMN02910417_00641 [Eubacterium oxidoreducens]